MITIMKIVPWLHPPFALVQISFPVKTTPYRLFCEPVSQTVQIIQN